LICLVFLFISLGLHGALRVAEAIENGDFSCVFSPLYDIWFVLFVFNQRDNFVDSYLCALVISR